MFELIKPENFPILVETLEKRLPKSAMLYNVTRLLQNGSFPSTISTTIYSFQGKLEETEVFKDVFIVAVQFREAYKDFGIIISAPNFPTDGMIEEFEKLIDWKYPNCFCAVDRLFSKFAAKLCTKHQGLEYVDPCNFMTMEIPKAKEIEIRNPDPSTIQIKELSPEHADLVSSRWKFAQKRTEILMSEYIKHIGSAGVFFNDELISWVVIFAMGSINALYTEDDHRGKGYGKLTMQKILKVAGEKGLVPNVQIHLDNNPSKSLMDSVGFIKSHVVEWVMFTPTIT